MIRKASTVSQSDLHSAMNAAFSDYSVPMQLSAEAFELMMRARGLNTDLSHAVLVEGEIAAFWLVGARDTRAYLIASGTLPAFRRRGLSRVVGEAVIDHLASEGFSTLQSEVLETNDRARPLYRSLGFTEKRTLDSYRVSELPPRHEASVDVTACAISALSSSAGQLWDSEPSWQNDSQSVIAAGDDAACFAINDASGLAAYAAILPAQSSLAQIAVRRDRRRGGLATQLLAQAMAALDMDGLRVINVDRDNAGLSAFLDACGASRLASQKELWLRF
ncbi:MAG: GNAT family N-acetyltransferase [Pseudomonadota bacterium]